MNPPWIECWLECQRLAARTSWRTQRWVQSRRLHVAEHQLGELGWQQAEFDPNDAHIRELRTQEQAEARLVFEIAEQKEQLAELKSVSETRLTDLHEQIGACEADAVQQETHALRMQKLLQAERANRVPFYLIESDEKACAAAEATLRDTRERLQSLQKILEKDEEQTRLELARLQTSLTALEKQLRDLQEKKATHFAHIGHELADVGIAPINQPGTLTRVLALREKITDLDFQLAYSLSQSQPLRLPIHLAALAIFTLVLVAALFLLLIAIALAWKHWRG